MESKSVGPLLIQAASKYNLDPSLLAAVIMQESGGNRFAFRYEPGFFNRYIRGKTLRGLGGYFPPSNICNVDSELNARATSFGLFQIMGQTAREYGFRGHCLTELLDEANNIELGAKILGKLLAKYPVEQALYHYNAGEGSRFPAGTIPPYAKEVLARRDKKEGGHLLLA